MGHPNSLHFRELTWLLRNIFKHSISSQTCWDFLQHNHTLYCYLHLECELKMEQRHPVTQMALSFRDHSGLQTPVVSQQPGFYEKRPPSRVRVLGVSVLRAEVTFAALLSGVDVTAGACYASPVSQWTSFLYTLLPAFPLLLPQFIHLFPPNSPVLSSSSLATVRHKEDMKVRPRSSSQGICPGRQRVVPLMCRGAQELSMVLTRLSDAQGPLPVTDLPFTS